MTNWKRSNRKRTLTPLATPPSTIPPLLSPPPPTMAGLHWSFFERRHTRHRDTYAVLLGRPHHPAGKFLKIESSTGGQRLTCAYTNSLWMMQTCRHTRAYIHSYIHTYRERLSERKEGWSRDWMYPLDTLRLSVTIVLFSQGQARFSPLYNFFFPFLSRSVFF